MPDPDQRQPAPDVVGELPLELVRRVAELARLELDASRLDALAHELGAVVAHAGTLRTLDLQGVEPLVHAGDAVNRLDDDTPGPVLATAALGAMAPGWAEPFVRVPKVLGGGEPS